jgi:hypothetical protein
VDFVVEEILNMAYTRNRRRRAKPALGMDAGERSFISRFFFPDDMVDPDRTGDLRAVRHSVYRFSLVAHVIHRIYHLVRLIRGS